MTDVRNWHRLAAAAAAALVLTSVLPAAWGAAAPAPLHVGIVNHSAAALECHAVAGHWYGFDLGTIAAGASTELMLGLERATGTVSIPNSLHQPVPIQSIYCGRGGDAWRTRAVLPLRRLADSPANPVAIVCRDERAALRCD